MTKDLEGLSSAANEESEKMRPITDFIYEEEFYIEGVTEKNYETSAIVGEPLIGGRNQTQSTGYVTTATLKVKPEKEIPVRTLVFKGHTTARQGDRIIARVTRFNTTFLDRFSVYDEDTKEVYSDRPYKEEETAIEIRNATQGRIEQAIDYV